VRFAPVLSVHPASNWSWRTRSLQPPQFVGERGWRCRPPPGRGAPRLLAREIRGVWFPTSTLDRAARRVVSPPGPPRPSSWSRRLRFWPRVHFSRRGCAPRGGPPRASRPSAPPAPRPRIDFSASAPSMSDARLAGALVRLFPSRPCGRSFHEISTTVTLPGVRVHTARSRAGQNGPNCVGVPVRGRP
jgi:hypothetical protein